MRRRGMFHLCLHPENVSQSPRAFAVFEAITDLMRRARDTGDAEILTMGQVAARMQALRAGVTVRLAEAAPRSRGASARLAPGPRPA